MPLKTVKMLRRIVVENYVNFAELQDLNFSPKHQHNLYPFVGENGSGKSSLLELIEYAALDFRSKEIRGKINVSDRTKDALMFCSFDIDTEDEDMLMYELHPYLRDNHKVCGDGDEEEKKQEEEDKKLIAGFFFDHTTKKSKDTVKFYFFKSQTSCIACIEGYRNIDDKFHERSVSTGRDEPDETFFSVVGDYLLSFDWRDAHKIANNITKTLEMASNPIQDEQTISIQHETTMYDKIITYMKKKIMKSFTTDSSATQPSPPEIVATPIRMTQTDKEGRQNFVRYILDLCEAGEIDFEELNNIWADIIGNRDIRLHDDLLKSIRGEFMEGSTTANNKTPSRFCCDKRTGKEFDIDQLPSGMASAFEIASQLAYKKIKTLLMDEPSQCMHISQIKRLRQVLLRYSAKEKRRCIIVTTHSPRMIDSKNFYNVFRFRTDGHTGTSSVSWIRGHDQKTIRFLVDPRVSEIYFAEAVLWVEGDDEVKFLESLCSVLEDLLAENYTARGLDRKTLENALGVLKYHTVLPVNGKKNIGKVRMCDQLQVPKVVICDIDAVLHADTDLKKYRQLTKKLKQQNDNVQQQSDVVHQLSENEQQLSATVKRQSANVQQLSENVQQLSGNVQQESDNVQQQSNIVQQLSDNVQQLSDNVNRQSDNVLRLSANVEQLSANVQQQCDNVLQLRLTSKVNQRTNVEAAKCLPEVIRNKLKDCETVEHILNFFQNHNVFAWSVGNGEIEDIVQIARKGGKQRKMVTFTKKEMDDICQKLIDSNHTEIKRFFSFLSNMSDNVQQQSDNVQQLSDNV